MLSFGDEERDFMRLRISFESSGTVLLMWYNIKQVKQRLDMEPRFSYIYNMIIFIHGCL